MFPHACDIAILLQMIVGAWPLDLLPTIRATRKSFAGRLAQWQEKALREAKLATDWAVPNENYESAARELLDCAFARNRHQLCWPTSLRLPKASARPAP